ncbi:Uncharacterised protein [Mycobacteroides abscessus subsp. abscessus]|nr:Uncharacterised protein [Mycobacteroides abscessus subsp. abscessus]
MNATWPALIAMNTTIITVAAAVTIRPVRMSPNATACLLRFGVLSVKASHASRIRERTNIS